ncbi:hypothetical protein [Thalassospira alkalitolerans]
MFSLIAQHDFHEAEDADYVFNVTSGSVSFTNFWVMAADRSPVSFPW